MTRPACPVCSGIRGTVFLRERSVPVPLNVLHATEADARSVPRGDIALAVCPDCGMVWNASFDRRLTSYDGDYENSLHGSDVFSRYASELADRLVETYGIRGKDVVEVGAGRGEFLAMICAAGGNRGVGFDPSTAAANGSGQPGVRLVRGEYPEDDRDLPVDLLVCRHVLEHVLGPLAFLRSIRQALGDRADVVTYVEVPDAGYMLDELAVWDVLYEHRSYFTQPSLARILGEAGFAVRRISTAYEGQFLSAEASPGGPVDPGDADPDEIEEIARSARSFDRARWAVIERWGERVVSWREEGRRVALWGAGSKGVTFLNSVPGAAELDVVVDVNARKHGRHVSGTGQPIAPPSALASDPPDVVVVLNPVYRDEVARALEGLGIGATVEVDDPTGTAVAGRRPPRRPRVSIGLPVHNGARGLDRALGSLRGQSFHDLEIVICDNASDDGTREICLRHADGDPRIRYYRNEMNVGAARNFNRTFQLARGEYFKWAAHDDWCEPTFVERCVGALEDDPGAVLAFTGTEYVDAGGSPVRRATLHDLGAPSPFRRGMRWLRAFECTPPIFGLIRAEALDRTELMGSEVGADKVLLTRLVLLGRWVGIADPLLHCFINRRTPDPSGTGTAPRKRIALTPERMAWWDPANLDRAPLWRWRFLASLLHVILRSPVPLVVRLALTPLAIARCVRRDGRQMLTEAGRLVWPPRRGPSGRAERPNRNGSEGRIGVVGDQEH